MPRLFSLSAAALVLLCLVPESVAQVIPQTQPAAVYRFAEAGTPTMEVRVWGAVRSPGVYQVARETDLVSLLSLAGGPLHAQDAPNVERTVTISVSRGEEGRRSLIYEGSLPELVRAPAGLMLQDGDVVALDVDVVQRFSWRDGLTIFSALGSVAIIVLNIMRLSN
jgi:hypothetical protein